VANELQLIRMMSSEILRLMGMRDEVDARIEKAGSLVQPVQALRPCLGAVTAAVVYAYLGAPNDYGCAAAFEKAAGLNLIERSSGDNDGTKHLSKRGPGIVRKYLFLAAMRLIHADPVAKAWYQARKSFKTDQKAKALIAVERKLCRALFHVAAGNPFDTSKLFDTRRLPLSAAKTEAA
jgi:transposase